MSDDQGYPLAPIDWRSKAAWLIVPAVGFVVAFTSPRKDRWSNALTASAISLFVPITVDRSLEGMWPFTKPMK